MQALHEHIAQDGFRLRGLGMSRIDGFSDVVFGFALTLLVVSLEVPHTYAELHIVLLGFLPFALCFVFLMMVWWDHFCFFRRYGLHDIGTVVINAALLFTLLFYVYPLKFLSTLVTGHAAGPVFTSALQQRELMMVYAVGFAAIYFWLAALYWNALRQTALRLNPVERTLTKISLADNLGVCFIGLLCCLLARLLPPAHAGSAGFFFFTIGIWKTVLGFASHKFLDAARERTPPEDSLPLH
ncbi:MAG TPA: TMEM175 family protein [Acidobacteriaceae bacterium]